MNISFHDRSEVGLHAWDAIVERSPDGWAFSLYGWQELILRVAEWGLRDYSFAVQENGRFVAMVPLQFDARSNLLASSGWGGSGPVLAADLRSKDRTRLLGLALERCLEIARSVSAHRMAISCSPVTRTSLERPWGVNEFIFHGFDDCSALSQVIDLRVEQAELWKRLSADARRQIRKAEESGVRVERAKWHDDLDGYYTLHRETYLRTGVQPHPKAYFAGIAAHMTLGDHAVLWKAVAADGTPIAYHNAAWFGPGAYYHTGCSSNSAAETGASYRLFWEALLGAKAAGIDWYDCGAIFPNATDSKQSGLTTFKRKFGGEAHRIFRSELNLQPDAVPAVLNSNPVEAVSFYGLARELARRAQRKLRGT